MSFDNFLNRLDEVAQLVQENQFLSNESFALQKEHGIKSRNDFLKDKAELEKANRLLKIGILGQVNSGKSSFLNSLIFNGKNILPKAATPMTAALSVLEYSKTPSLSVEFYSLEDLSEIEKRAKSFERELENTSKAKFDELKDKASKKGERIDELKLKEDAKKQALKDLKDKQLALFTCWEQHGKILKSQVSVNELKANHQFEISLQEIQIKLKDYVGSEGKFMPFTKSITLRLDNEFLKDVQIIDTPGLNDPVPSRSARTNEFLENCDAVLVLSPAERCMEENDVKLIRRLFGYVARIFFIASKADTELFGSKKVENNGILSAVFESIQNTLEGSKEKALRKYEIESDVLQRALREKIILSASICAGIVAKKGKNLDEIEEFIFNRLKEEYKSDFEGEQMWENLSKLANIDALNAVFDELKKDKEVILQKRINDFLQNKTTALNTYIEALQNILKQRLNALQVADIDELEVRVNALQKVKERGEVALDNEWSEICDDFCLNIQRTLKKQYADIFDALENNIKGECKDFTKTTGILIKDTHYLKEISANAVRLFIIQACEELERLFDESKSKIQKWRQEEATERTLGALRKEVGDEFIDSAIFRKCIRQIFSQISYPSIKYISKIPDEIRGASGVLQDSVETHFFEDDEYYRPATRFINAVFEFTSNKLRESVKDDIDNFVKELTNAFNISFGKEMFKNLNEEIKSLQDDLKDKAKKIGEYNELERKLNAFLSK